MKFWHWDPALPMAAAALLAVLAYRLGLGLHAENERLRGLCRAEAGSAHWKRMERLFRGRPAYFFFAAGPSMALFTAFLVGVHAGMEPSRTPREADAGRIVLMVDPPPAPPPKLFSAPAWTPPGCRPLPFHTARRLVERVSREEGVSAELVLAVLYRESRFFPCAVSRSGAVGLMQLKPGTARLMGVRDYWDPEENIRAGARYLRFLLDRYGGNVTLALGAYHAGPGRVDRFGHLQKLPATRRYIGDVLSLAETFAGD